MDFADPSRRKQWLRGSTKTGVELGRDDGGSSWPLRQDDSRSNKIPSESTLSPPSRSRKSWVVDAERNLRDVAERRSFRHAVPSLKSSSQPREGYGTDRSTRLSSRSQILPENREEEYDIDGYDSGGKPKK